MEYEITNVKEWPRFLTGIDVVVPPRAEGRTKHHAEQWVAHKFFSFLSQHVEIFGVGYPLTIAPGDRPDISIHTKDDSIGIEQTEVVQPDYARAVAIAKQENIEGVIERSFFRWGQNELSLVQIRDIVSRKRLAGKPLMGDAVEKEFAQAVFDVVLKKDERLRQAGFERHKKDWLLMYYNHIAWGVECELAAKCASNKLASYWGGGFGRVFVIVNDCLVSFEPNSFVVYKT